MGAMKCSAAGDAMIFRRLPGRYEGFDSLCAFLAQGDFRFLNLETTVHHYEAYGAAESGGTWFCSQPEVLQDIRKFGFNILATANNHATDYGIEGLEKTLDYIRAEGFPVAGTGRTLAEASAPVYLDTLSGRYALISCTTSFNPDSMAGEQTRFMRGRPGVNGALLETTYQLPEEDFVHLSEIADKIGINDEGKILLREGYRSPLKENEGIFGTLKFQKAERAGAVHTIRERDRKRMREAISLANYMADYVVVSIHAHQIQGETKEEVPKFLEAFAHECIDAGAHAVVGTGPHLLRPIEIYKGCPIFYSLGDSFIQLETIQYAPADMYEKWGLTGNEGLDVLFDRRNAHGTRGLCYDRKMYEAVIPYWESEGGALTSLKLLPIECHFGQARSTSGFPRPDHHAGILERLAQMSKKFGTDIEIVDGIGVVSMK